MSVRVGTWESGSLACVAHSLVEYVNVLHMRVVHTSEWCIKPRLGERSSQEVNLNA
jgi:hypothetical protein